MMPKHQLSLLNERKRVWIMQKDCLEAFKKKIERSQRELISWLVRMNWRKEDNGETAIETVRQDDFCTTKLKLIKDLIY